MRFLLLALAVATGCAGEPAGPADAAAASASASAPAAPSQGPAASAGMPADTSGGPVVTLERSVCYGTCPAYTVSAYAGGRVVFDGREYVARPGRRETRVAPAVVAGLVAQAIALDHAGYPDALVGPGECPSLSTDAPTTTTVVRTTAGTSRVARNGGCTGFRGRDALVAFEDAVDAALVTAPFVGAP